MPETWTKSKRCDAGNCVEVRRPRPGFVEMQDTKNPGMILVFSEAEWQDLVEKIQHVHNEE